MALFTIIITTGTTNNNIITYGISIADVQELVMMVNWHGMFSVTLALDDRVESTKKTNISHSLA